MNLSGFLKVLSDNAVKVSAVLAALVAVASTAYKLKTHFSRSRLLRADAFPLPEVPSEQAIFADNYRDLDTMLVGRDSEISAVAGDVRSSMLTFVYGESGSGKSTFLKLGLCRELASRRGWVPIYIDVWGSDWERGPWNALADSTDFALRAVSITGLEASSITRESVFERLRNLRKTVGRRPLLVFDQIDDYQNAHRTTFRRPGTQFLLSPDELCAANPFWREIRDLLLEADEPVHLLLATRDDAQDGLHCFEFTKPSVYQLPRLGPGDAVTLVQRLTPDSIVKNPENGFTELTQRIAAELGNEHAGAILPMQLRMALAGLGTLSGPLTPGRLDELGGVAALGALYLDNVLRHSPEAWPIINAMAERSTSGQPKAIGLSRHELLSLLPAGVPPQRLLKKLVAKRILRQRLEGSPDEVWQLYHDYLAAAIVELDRRRRKWFIVLSSAAQRFRLADGPMQWWLRLLTPSIQLRLFLQRLAGRGFDYGEYGGFARISLLRLVINVWTLSLAAGLLGWTLWRQNQQAQVIIDAFHQGDDNVKQYDALWLLAASPSGYLRQNVIARFLSTPDNAQELERYSSSILSSLGLRASSLDILADLSASGPCLTPSNPYIETCDAIALFSAEAGPRANQIIELLAKTSGPEAAYFSAELAAFAPQLNGDQAERGANRIVDLMAKASEREAGDLGEALGALVPQLKSDQAGVLANRIVDLMAKTSGYETVYLGEALAALAPQVKGDQAGPLVSRIVDLGAMATGPEAVYLGKALGALAPQLKGDQAERGANRIVDLMAKTSGNEAAHLGIALAALAPQVNGNQAERGASRIVDLMAKASGNEAAHLGIALGALAPQLKGDQAERGANRIVDLMAKTSGDDAGDLGIALAALSSQVKGDQAGRLGNRIVELLAKASGFEAADWGAALAALAPQLKGDQTERGANRIVNLLTETSQYEQGYDAAYLAKALAALAPQLKGDQAERGANRIVDLIHPIRTNNMDLIEGLAALAAQVKGDQAVPLANRIVDLQAEDSRYEVRNLGDAVAALAPQVKSDQAVALANRIVDLLSNASVDKMTSWRRGLAALIAQVDSTTRRRLLATIIERRQGLPCDLAVVKASHEEAPLLLDMIKWPICEGGDGIMLRIAELQNASPLEFGQFGKAGDRSTFKANRRKFIAWLRTQRDPHGKDFDIDGPPIWSPQNPPSASH